MAKKSIVGALLDIAAAISGNSGGSGSDDVSSSALICELNYDPDAAKAFIDKTYNEINEALIAGRPVYYHMKVVNLDGDVVTELYAPLIAFYLDIGVDADDHFVMFKLSPIDRMHDDDYTFYSESADDIMYEYDGGLA